MLHRLTELAALQIERLLVQRDPPGFANVDVALAAFHRLQQETLAHVHEHADALMKFSKATQQVSRNVRSMSGVPCKLNI